MRIIRYYKENELLTYYSKIKSNEAKKNINKKKCDFCIHNININIFFLLI